MSARRGSSLWLTVVAMLLAGGCDSGTTSQSAADPRFASAEALVEHTNSLATDGEFRLRDFAPLIYAETDFQHEFKQSLDTVARAESIQDAVMDRFGEPVDAANGDIRIRTNLGELILADEEDGRASAAAFRSTGEIREVMLVQVDGRWWISGYTWEYSMSDHRKAEMSRRLLVFQVDAAIAPDMVSRITSGEFASISEFRAAYRDALIAYFEANPDIYQRITGKRPPGR